MDGQDEIMIAIDEIVRGDVDDTLLWVPIEPVFISSCQSKARKDLH